VTKYVNLYSTEFSSINHYSKKYPFGKHGGKIGEALFDNMKWGFDNLKNSFDNDLVSSEEVRRTIDYVINEIEKSDKIYDMQHKWCLQKKEIN